RDRPNAADDLRELLAVAHFQPEDESGRIAFRVDAHVIDVALRRGDAAGELREQTDAVERADLDLGEELALHVALPVHRDPLRRLLAVLDQVPAVAAMNDDAAAARHEADDLVARDRVAAARVVHDHTF